MHIHILGICGTFMGGVAALAREAGHKVTGCDAGVYPPMSDQLRALGIDLIEGYSADQIQLKPDLFVIGNVVSRGNPLMEAILDADLPYTSGPQWLSENVLQGRHVLAVAGTHGKTTTTSMLTWILEACGLQPGFLVGGVPQNFGVSARLGNTQAEGAPASGRPFVIEADEYDTAFFDKRSKFVHYRPWVAVLNNLEYDHADIFPDLAAIETQFHHLVRTVPGGGRIVCPTQTESLQRVLKRGCWTPVDHFGDGGDWQARMLGASRFEVMHGGVLQGEVDWAWSGAHNVSNALAVIAAAHAMGVEPALACKALSEFPGVKRRMELRGTADGVRVYDDFAHHPTAIATTLEGARALMLEQAKRDGTSVGRLIALFEPRSNTMKMGTLAQALPASFDEADVVYCYTAGISWNVRDTLGSLGERLGVSTDITELVNAVVNTSKPGDWVLAMSNGAFGGIHQKLLDALQARQGNRP